MKRLTSLLCRGRGSTDNLSIRWKSTHANHLQSFEGDRWSAIFKLYNEMFQETDFQQCCLKVLAGEQIL